MTRDYRHGFSANFKILNKLKGIPIAEGGFCLRITPIICGLDIIFMDIK